MRHSLPYREGSSSYAKIPAYSMYICTYIDTVLNTPRNTADHTPYDCPKIESRTEFSLSSECVTEYPVQSLTTDG